MKSDSVFKALLCVISLVAFPLTHSIYSNHLSKCTPSSLEMASWCPSLMDFALPSLLFASAFIVLRYVFVWFTAPVARCLIHRGKSSDTVYFGKVTRLSHNFFKSFYFLTVALYAYNLLQGEPFFPAELGGPALRASSLDISVFRTSVAQSNLISAKAFPFVKCYFLMSAGFQFATIYFLLAESQHSDLWETVVQVALALQLIFYGYMAKHLAVGACLLLMHDTCDVLTSACKALVHTSYKVSTFMGTMILMVIWGYTRLYCLGKLILIPLLKEIEQRESWENVNFELFLFAILLLSLFFMNIYWFSLMSKSAVIFVNSGRVTDVHAPILTDTPMAFKRKKA